MTHFKSIHNKLNYFSACTYDLSSNKNISENGTEQNDAEEDIDRKAAGDASNNTEQKPPVKSTRKWAEETNYDAEKLFNKLFGADIDYLLSMEKLWEKRKPPTPIAWNQAKIAVADANNTGVV